MRRRKLAITGLIGFVLGALIATVIVVRVTRDDSPADATARKADKPSSTAPVPTAAPITAKLPTLDMSRMNRRTPIAGLPDWSKAGYRDGGLLPDAQNLDSYHKCWIDADRLADDFDVRPNDSKDDSDGLQKAIDSIREECSLRASYDQLSLIELPVGELDVSKQLWVDTDYLIIRGAGADKTHFVFRPDENTRYDALTKDGGDWDEDGMEFEDGNGGWLWPGRGLFRVQSRAVHPDYQEAYEKAPANRKDLFEGTVNVHWKAGLKLREKPGGAGFAAKAGDTVIYLDPKASMDSVKPGGYVNMRAANTMKFYEQQQALPTDHDLQNLHMRQQLRRFALQWSSSGNVVIGNDTDSDLNLHGGWERRNLFELNTVHVPYEHRSANCKSNGVDASRTDSGRSLFLRTVG
ncbi:hypothetical protein OHA18_39520 [Kribbella sp. NBC_00709]|uniref:hypothetical protein n=1 Tax=Kribbella sp. NBC_00709 TaxID=2975972 RepID=UPI002E28A98A|nr:hypothetical protein [Kribbella sp. NBC_00709]